MTLVTPSAFVTDWTRNTLEQEAVHKRLVVAGMTIVLNKGVMAEMADCVETNSTYTARREQIGCGAVVIVASRGGRTRFTTP